MWQIVQREDTIRDLHKEHLTSARTEYLKSVTQMNNVYNVYCDGSIGLIGQNSKKKTRTTHIYVHQINRGLFLSRVIAPGDHLPTSPCFSFSVAAVYICVRALPRSRTA